MIFTDAGWEVKPQRGVKQMSSRNGSTQGRTIPMYKLRSDIEQMTNLKKILEECGLDSHVRL